MPATYDPTSPYYNTGYSQFFLDVMINRPIPAESDDQIFKINTTYQYRPDLLAYDLYGDADLWWVFTARNPNVLRDPVFDFLPGVEIYVPNKNTLTQDLGL